MTKNKPPKSVTKASLAAQISCDLGIYPGVARDVIEAFIAGVTAALVAGERVEFRNFGVFTTKTRMARTARNPNTNEVVSVPACRSVSFKPGLALKKLEPT